MLTLILVLMRNNVLILSPYQEQHLYEESEDFIQLVQLHSLPFLVNLPLRANSILFGKGLLSTLGMGSLTIGRFAT
jgi:hypothetical protein